MENITEHKEVISVGSDHAGFELKEAVISWLSEHNYAVVDHGTHSSDSTDYPDHIHPVAADIKADLSKLGIILCGSGNGAAMTANKHQYIRAANCWNAELAVLARKHNDANVLAIPARFINEEVALEVVKAFLESKFEGGRHVQRVNKIALVDC